MAQGAGKPAPLTPDEHQAAGEALFGRYWQQQLATALGRSRAAMQFWRRGLAPAGSRERAVALLRRRAEEIEDVMHDLRAPALLRRLGGRDRPAETGREP